MTHQRAIIPLGSLLLDRDNARHGNLPDQNAVLKWMVSQSKVLNLARSISANGPSPIDLPIVIPVEGQQGLFEVVEGNRRTAVLKLLQDPEKCPDERSRSFFRKLRQDSRVALPTELECVVFPDLESAQYWIKTRHLGEQGGAGTVQWGAKENAAWAERMSLARVPNEPAKKLLDYALSKKLITQEEYDEIPLTNVTRLLGTPNVRRELGINVVKGEVTRLADVEYVDRALAVMLKTLTKPKVTVSVLKSKEDRERFIREVKDGEGLGTYRVRDEVPLGVTDPPPSNLFPDSKEQPVRASGDNTKQERTSRNPMARKFAISSNVSMKIENKKLRLLFGELKELEVGEFPNAVAVLTRVFIEGLIDVYIAKHKLPTKNQQSLAGKVNAVVEHIKTTTGNPQAARNDLKGLEAFANSEASIGSANSFNAVIHNSHFVLTDSELKTNWDRLEPCLRWFQGHV